MRILIDNSGYEMKNLGDIAMLQIAISRIKNIFPDAELHVFTTNSERLERYCPNVIAIPAGVSLQGRSLWGSSWSIFGGLHKITPKKYTLRLQLFEQKLRNIFPRAAFFWIRRRLKKRQKNTEELDNFYSIVNSADVVVASGGGYLTDFFENHAATVLGTLALAQALGKQTFLFGQGLGPLQSPWLQGLCRQILPQVKGLFLREGQTGVAILKSLNMCQPTMIITGDDAVELAYTRRPDVLGNAIGVNLRLAEYSEVGEATLHQMRAVLSCAARNYHAALIPIPISGHEADSDFSTIAKLIEYDVDHLATLDTPEKIIANVAECRIVITGSYHAGVFALSQGISVIGLAKSVYYKDKFNGLSSQFKVGCLVVDLSSSSDFSDALLSAIEKSWQSAPENRESLLEQARYQIEVGQKAYRELYKWIGK